MGNLAELATATQLYLSPDAKAVVDDLASLRPPESAHTLCLDKPPESLHPFHESRVAPLSYQQFPTYLKGAGEIGLEILNMEGDGSKDVVVRGGENGQIVSIIRNENGNMNVVGIWDIKDLLEDTPYENANLIDIASGDLNNDCNQQLVFITDQGFLIFTYQGDGNFSNEMLSADFGESGPIISTIDDLSGDQRDDIVFIYYLTNGFRVVQAKQAPGSNFSLETITEIHDEFPVQIEVLPDLDGDDLAELAVATDHTLYLLASSTDHQPEITIPIKEGIRKFSADDLSGDGNPDLTVLTQESQLRIYWAGPKRDYSTYTSLDMTDESINDFATDAASPTRQSGEIIVTTPTQILRITIYPNGTLSTSIIASIPDQGPIALGPLSMQPHEISVASLPGTSTSHMPLSVSYPQITDEPPPSNLCPEWNILHLPFITR
jgi:hypothetical protein